MNSLSLGLLVAVGVCVTVLPGCNKPDVQATLAEARERLGRGEARAAVIQLKAMLQDQPSSADLRLLLGQALLETDDAPSAIIEIRKAAELKADAAKIVPLHARALIAAGRYREAIQLFKDKKLGVAVADADLQASLSMALLMLRDRPAAEQAIEKALALAPTHAPALLVQARLAAAAGPGRPIEIIDGVLKREPENVDALLLRGDLLCAANASDKRCFAAYEKVLALRNYRMEAHAGLVTASLRMTDLAGARKRFEAMQQALPQHPQTRFFEAQITYSDGNVQKARELTQLLLRAYPDSAPVHQFAGLIEMQKQSLQQAESHFNKAIHLDPDLVQARLLLAQTYLVGGQPRRVHTVLEPLLARDHVASMLIDARAYMQDGEFAKAEEILRKAVALRPQDATARTALAVARIGEGQIEAINELESVASTDSGDVADMAIISNRLRRNEFVEALKAIDRLQAKQPKNPAVPHLRGVALQRRGDPAGARVAFENALTIAPDYFPPMLSLAAMDIEQNKPDAARARFERLLETDPNNLRVITALASVVQRTDGKPAEVLKLLETAVRVNPVDAELRLGLVDFHVRHGNRAAARTAMQEAQAALPDDLSLMLGAGQLQMSAREYDKAIRTFSAAAAKVPQAVEPMLRLAEANVRIQNFAAARTALDQILTRRPDSLAAQKGLISLALLEEKPADAIKVVKSVQKQRPDSAVGYVLEGDVLVFRNDRTGALDAYLLALRKDPSTEGAGKTYALYRSLGRDAEAKRFATDWKSKYPRDADFLFHAGNTAMEWKDYAVAEQFFTETVKLQPLQVPALNNAAWSKLQGKRPGALPLAERAHALAPNSPAVLDTYARALLAEGQASKALVIQSRAVALQPGSHDLRLTLVKTAIAAGDVAKAKAELMTLAKLGSTFASQTEVQQLLNSL